ncbi:MAG TPA: tRNA 2-thiocytidine(32) synthetase TtcA [Proteobacteria bacterium]|nr:tRNA 2-thiocytidine(32) synthetase TtcA [Pseudomonadota bacterium]
MPNIDKEINRFVGRALHQYDLLADGDHILIGLSGGKDSLSLLYILNEWKKKTPFPYKLSAAHIDLGFDGTDTGAIEDYCRQLSVPCYVERTNFGPMAHSEENRENPCFLCSRLRRKRLFEIAHTLGANKVALGHNKDDLIETLFLNIFYSGEISTMVPRQPFFNGLITVIRPLAMVDAEKLERFAVRLSMPEIKNPCPSAGSSCRKEIREMLKTLYRQNKKVKGNIFHALSNVHPDYLL